MKDVGTGWWQRCRSMSDAEEAVYEHPTASDTIIEDATQRLFASFSMLATWLFSSSKHVSFSMLVCKHVNTLLGVIPQLGALQNPDAPLAKWDSTPIGSFCPSIVKQQILPWGNCGCKSLNIRDLLPQEPRPWSNLLLHCRGLYYLVHWG